MQTALDSMILTFAAVLFPAVVLVLVHLALKRYWRDDGLFVDKLALGLFGILLCVSFAYTGMPGLLFTGTLSDLPELILGEVVSVGFGLVFGIIFYTGYRTCSEHP